MHRLQASLTLSSAPYVQFDWKPEQGSVIHVVPLNGDTSKIRHIKAPTYFTFHYVNAYETDDGSTIHIDFGNFDGPDILNDFYLDSMRASNKSIKEAPLVCVRPALHKLYLHLHPCLAHKTTSPSEKFPWCEFALPYTGSYLHLHLCLAHRTTDTDCLRNEVLLCVSPEQGVDPFVDCTAEQKQQAVVCPSVYYNS